MEALMDQIWLYIVDAITMLRRGIDLAIAPVNHIGPQWAILLLAAITAGFTKTLARLYRPKRYRRLRENFEHWYKIRQKALEDGSEKGRLLAKNIDQAHLNKAYYDLFFEGLLISLLTRYLPILSAFAYVNEAYRPDRLQALWTKPTIFIFRFGQDRTLSVGGNFWFLICLFAIYAAIWIVSLKWGNKEVKPAGGSKSGVSSQASVARQR